MSPEVPAVTGNAGETHLSLSLGAIESFNLTSPPENIGQIRLGAPIMHLPEVNPVGRRGAQRLMELPPGSLGSALTSLAGGKDLLAPPPLCFFPVQIQIVTNPSGARLVASITMLISRCSSQLPEAHDGLDDSEDRFDGAFPFGVKRSALCGLQSVLHLNDGIGALG